MVVWENGGEGQCSIGRGSCCTCRNPTTYLVPFHIRLGPVHIPA